MNCPKCYRQMSRYDQLKKYVCHYCGKFTVHDHEQKPRPSAGLDGSTANDISSVEDRKKFTDEEARKVLSFFEDAGMKIELGAQYSAKGQIAQLLNGARELLKHVERDVLA